MPISASAVIHNAWAPCFTKRDGPGANGYRDDRGRAMSLGRSSRGWWPCIPCHCLVLSIASSDSARTCTMKNRMHELCSFGSVRDEGRKALVYSEILQAGLTSQFALHKSQLAIAVHIPLLSLTFDLWRRRSSREFNRSLSSDRRNGTTAMIRAPPFGILPIRTTGVEEI
jgi:hypothetical protein